MLRQTDRDAIPAALPPHVAVANKTGEIDGTRNDIAIVEPFGESPLILAVMTKDAYDYSASYAAIHAVTHAVYASDPAAFPSGDGAPRSHTRGRCAARQASRCAASV